MKSKVLRTLSLAFLAAGILSAGLLHAQALPNNESTADENEEVITLSEFTVTTERLKDSYIAMEAAAGTRTGERIIDIPFTVQVFTQDFIDDFQLFETDDLMGFVATSTAGTGTSTGVRVRGFESVKTRDGFRYAVIPPHSNVKQVEVIKGPMSIMYGQTTPGGIINYISARPTQKFRSSVYGTYGTDDYIRAAATISGPIVKNKLFYHVYYEYQHSEVNEKFVERDTHYMGATLLYKFREGTSLMATLEYQPEKNQEVSNVILYDTAPAASRQRKGIRYWTGIGDFNHYYSPTSWRKCDYWGYYLLFEHKINVNWAFRAAGLFYSKDTDKQRWTDGTSLYEDTWTTSARSPYTQDQDESCYAFQVDLTGKYRIGSTNHRILLAIDGMNYDRDNEERKGRWNNTNGLNAGTLGVTRARSIANPKYDEFFDFSLMRDLKDLGGYFTRTNLWAQDNDVIGGLVSYRVSFLRDKLAIAGSGRIDKYSYKYTDQITAAKNGKRTGDKFTYSLGVNYKILGDNLLAYASLSTGYETKSTTIDRGTNKMVEPEESQALEIGLKGVTSSGYFGYTLSAYKLDIDNARTNNHDWVVGDASSGKPEFFTGGENQAKGAEINTFWKPVEALTLSAGFGIVDSEVKKGSDGYSVGRPMQYASKYTASFSAKYRILSGALKGTAFGVSAKYRSEYMVAYESSAVYELMRPSTVICDAFISYGWKTGKFNHSLSLNIRNLLDKNWYLNNGRKADGIEGRLAYSIKY